VIIRFDIQTNLICAKMKNAALNLIMMEKYFLVCFIIDYADK